MLVVLRPRLCTREAKWAERPPRSEVKDETPFRYAHAEIRTQMIGICGPTRYQLGHGGAAITSESCQFNRLLLFTEHEPWILSINLSANLLGESSLLRDIAVLD